MARRKRASMREGPLADLFRATVDPDDPPEAPSPSSRSQEDETRVNEPVGEQPPREGESDPASEPAFFDQVEETYEPEPSAPAVEPPAAKERLSRIFADDV